MSFQKIDREMFPQLFESPLYAKILSLIGTGWEQGVHVRDICRATELDNRGARKAIETICRAGVVVCTDCLHGYFYPETVEELGLYIRQEERRGHSTFYTLKAARELYKQRGGGDFMEKKRSFPCYLDYKKPLELLTVAECGELWLAMFDYEETGALPNFTGALAMAFSFIRSQMDRDRAAYEEKCRKNAENGAKGGRPSKAENPFKE